MKKTLKIVLSAIVGLCLVVIIGGYILLTQVDFNSYKKNIVDAVYNSTGRQLEIGNIQIKPSFTPVVEVRDLTLSNAVWAKNPVMVSVKSIDLGIAIIPLLKKSIKIDSFKVSDAVVNLEENAENGVNWDFSVAEKNDDEQVSFAPRSTFSVINNAYAEDNLEKSNSDIGKTLSSFVIKEALLDNVTLNYTDKSGTKQSYVVKSLTLDENDESAIDYTFNVNDGLYAGKGMFGTFNRFDDKDGYPFKGDINVMGININLDVKLYDTFGDMRFVGNVKAKNFIGSDSGYNESAEVEFNGDLKKVNAIVKSVNVAGNEITGNVSADLADKPSVVGQFKTLGIDIASFEKKKKVSFEWSLIKEAQATTLAPEKNIPYSLFNSLNADIDVDVAKIANKNKVVGENIVIKATINNGVASLRILNGKIANGSIKSNISLEARGKKVSAKLDIQKLNLLNLMAALSEPSDSFKIMSGSDTDVFVDVVGNGNTYANVVDSLDGRAVVILGTSQIHLGNIGMLKGNIVSQLLNTLNLTKGNDDLNLTCAVIRTDIKEGEANFPNGIAINADKFTVVSSGDINLKTDKISLSIKPFAGKLTDTNIVKALSSLVKLTGTLDNPKIGVDSANAIKTLVGVTTAGPVYLGAQMLLENDGSPCYTALDGTGYESRFPKSENVVKQTSGDVGKMLDNGADVVKDTTKGLLNILSGAINK